ncbi:MAG: hypothetical protein WAW59_04225 [Patescibacteria group bacterium]
MKNFLALFTSVLLLSGIMIQTAEGATRIRTKNPAQYTTSPYYAPAPVVHPVYYGNPYTVNNGATTQTYYFSPTYIQGYTYYSTPTPGYYYYLPVRTNVVYTQPVYNYHTNQYYTPQNYTQGTATVHVQNQGQYYYPSNYPYVTATSTYPGCNKANILIGGQEWAGCNSTDRNTSAYNQSGWFFGGDTQSSFLSYNGMGNSLAWQGRQTRSTSWTYGPCADGYRLPTRGEWETAIYYARQNGTSLASLLSLSYNGSFYGYRDTSGNVTLSARTDVNGAYWTSTFEGSNPTVLHLASGYAGYRTDGTDYSRTVDTNRWQYTDTGLYLTQSNYSEMANVRCIKR